MYEVIFTAEAVEGAKALRKSNAQSFKKLSKLIDELKEHPYTGTGHPKPLTHIPGVWSRHIDKKNRLLYTVTDTKILVTIISVTGHYGDK
ncbi:MAG: Txe/YoeB family addiction module toxin [Muribaculaceae bacterium]|nr:Txe/YoeB family addiction module toxin [Muribaculaceae bacterium]